MSHEAPSLTFLPLARWPRLLLFGSLALGLFLRLYIVFHDEGINWPDEIYQSFEPAHRLVFGYGLMPWEFIDGARTWATPGFVAAWLWLCKILGADEPFIYIRVVKIVFSCLSIVASIGVFRLARVLGAREREAVLSATTWSLCALALYYSHRAMSENLAAVLLIWGVALIFDERASSKHLWWGASLLGLATVFRLQSAIVCLGVVMVLWLQRRVRGGRAWTLVLGVLSIWALIFGVWDALAWHDVPAAKAWGLFHSAVVYFRFNVLENGGASWGTSHWSYYFVHLFRTMPGLTLVLFGASVLMWRRAWPVMLVVVTFLVIHLAMPHKELRFIVPIIPLVCALPAVAINSLGPERRRLALWVWVIAILASAARYRSLTMGDVGSYANRAHDSAWDDFGPVNRLLLAASRQRDLCGLRVDAAHLAWTGGSTYLHVRAPLYMPGFPPERGYFNYAITRPAPGSQEMAREGSWALIKLADTCQADPGYNWRLP